jgi:hypothetical protein
LNQCEPQGSAEPHTAWVTDKLGKKLHVRYDSLKPLSVGVDEKLMPKSLEDWQQTGNFIIFDTDQGLSAGTIMEIAGDKVTVHDWMPIECKTGVTWAPLWTVPSSKQPMRYVNRPASATGPHTREIGVQDYITTAALKGKKLDEGSVTRLRSLGYDLF